MQKARRQPPLIPPRRGRRTSDRLQAYGFRNYFTPLFRVLFTFPSRYWFTIGVYGVFSLTGWCRQFQVLRCFSSPRWLLFLGDAPSVQQVVPFGNLRIYRSCAAPRSLSQLTTSFFASQSQGIHHTPLFALKNFNPHKVSQLLVTCLCLFNY